MAERKTAFTWTTLLTPAQVREALEARVHAGPVVAVDFGLGRRDDKEFRGKVSDAGFSIMRRVLGRNSFVPIVTGEVRAVPQGAEVAVSMALPRHVSIFFALWALAAAGVLGWFVFTLPPEVPVTPVLTLAPFPLLAVALVAWVYRREVNRARDFLRALLPPAGPASATVNHEAASASG
ncbi:MAG: hypothetical protein IT380_07985 [Myxococcales bacterium]|nr:hypothetical protein [Myxococcales bacterium]